MSAFRTTLRHFFFLGYPAAISQKVSDYPAVILAGQVGPPPTLQFNFSRVPRSVLLLFFQVQHEISVSNGVGGKKIRPPRDSRVVWLWHHPSVISDVFADHPRSDIGNFLRPPRGLFFGAPDTTPPTNFSHGIALNNVFLGHMNFLFYLRYGVVKLNTAIS